MAKSMSKKILTVLLTCVAMVCLAFSCLDVSMGVNAYESYITEYDETHTYTEADARDVLTYIEGEIDNAYAQLKAKANGFVIDENMAKQSQVSAYEGKIDNAVLTSVSYNEIAEQILTGESGLNGILAISNKAIAFYDYYVAEDGGFATDEKSKYTDSNWTHLSADLADYLKGFKLSKFAPNYNINDAQAYYDGVQSVIDKYNQNEDDLVAFINARKDEVRAKYDEYHTAKYDVSVVVSIVPDSLLDETLSALDTCSSKTDATSITAEYRDKFIKVPTYMKSTLDALRAKDNGYAITAEDAESARTTKQEKALALLAECESIFGYYTDNIEGKPYEDVDDQSRVGEVLTLYKYIAKSAIGNVKYLRSGNFGNAAEATVGKNKTIATDLVDVLKKGGKLPSDAVYTYQTNARASKKVETGTDIVGAYEDSYYTAGAIRCNGKSSEVPLEKLSSITYSSSDLPFKITVKSFDSAHNEITDFDSDATLDVRVGALPSIERNINKILGGDKLNTSVASSVANAETIKSELKGKHLHYYFTLTVYEGGVVRTDFNKTYQVTIDFEDDIKEYTESINVINYYHTTITGAVAHSDITWEDGYIMSYFTNNFAQFGIVDTSAWTDWGMIALWVVIGLVALIVLITIVVLLIKNRKYKVKFNANGGKSNKTIKVKFHEKYAYPKNPTRKGYVFLGWFLTKSGETRFASTEMVTKHNVEVFAKWISESDYAEMKAKDEAAEESARQPYYYIQPATTEESNSKVDELETEKAEYEAKKAEEERKTEEARLAALQQIEESKANEEARLQAEKEAAEAKAQLEEALAKVEQLEKSEEEARREAEDAKRTAEEAEAARLAALAAVVVNEEPEEEPVEEVPEEEPEEPKMDTTEIFDKVKAEIYSYTKADDLPYGLDESVSACSLKVEGDTVVMEVNSDLDDLKAKGYNVSEGTTFPAKYTLTSDDDYNEAVEIIEEIMYENGFKKTLKAVITESTEETRNEGFVYSVTNENVASNAEEYYKLLRVYARSFVKADEGEVEQKNLIKMFMGSKLVYVYVNYSGEGLLAANDAIAAEGFGSFMIVRNTEDCKNAIKVISAMMKENGLVRYPTDCPIAGEKEDKGFTYTLK